MKIFPSKSVQNCSEAQVVEIAEQLAAELVGGDLVLLEGPMGVGKSTFARAFLASFGVKQGGAGSPTFAIAHEYQAPDGRALLHADLYRLKFEEELEETGVNSALWERQVIALIEWSSLFPEWVKVVEKNSPARLFRVTLDFESQPATRSIQIRRVK
jgi:tRNA threonylcarbamoyl adenosine modification protein YjeE